MTELIKSASIEELVAKRDAIVEQYRLMLQAFGTAERLAKSIALDGARPVSVPSMQLRFPLSGGARSATDWTDSKHLHSTAAEIDRAMWFALMRATQMDTILPGNAKDEWNAQVMQSPPVFTVSTVRETFSALYSDRHDLVAESVVDFFRQLSWDRKTNTPAMLGKRIIFQAGRPDTHGWRHVNYERINDIVRPMCLVMGELVPDYASGAWGWMLDDEGDRISLAAQLPRVWERPWFILRIHKNLSAHLTFTEETVRQRLNDIIASRYPGCLPASKK